MFLHFFSVNICSHCSNIHLVFTNEKGELTIPTSKHGLFAESHRTESLFSFNQLWAQRICRATNRKSLLSDHRSEGNHGHLRATWMICYLTTPQGHLPSPSLKTFFPDDAGFSYLLSKASGSKYMQLCRFSL